MQARMRGSSTSVEGERSIPCLEADDRYLLPCNKILDQALTRVCPCANSGTGIKGTRIPANGHVVLRRAQEVEQTIMASRKAQASMKHHTFTTLALLAALALPGQTMAQETQQDRKPPSPEVPAHRSRNLRWPPRRFRPFGERSAVHQQRWGRGGYRADTNSSSAE